jgi:hypothetical protein
LRGIDPCARWDNLIWRGEGSLASFEDVIRTDPPAGASAARDYEAQLNRASALSLVLNAIVVWNTRYLTAAAEELATQGESTPEDLWPHVSPLHWEHIHLVGRYCFEEPTVASGLRPLRTSQARQG